jgi:hypothetical protein
MKSSFISWNTKFSISGVLAIIVDILGWLWSDFILLDPTKPVIAKPISELINKSISLAKFPEKLKEAQVVQKEQCSR